MTGLNFINIKFWPIGRCVGTVVNARHINEVQPHVAAVGIAVLGVVVNIAVIDLTNSVGVSIEFTIRGTKTHLIVVALTPQDLAGFRQRTPLIVRSRPHGPIGMNHRLLNYDTIRQS